ncbi:helix-turn-helix transcriptional regulator [Jatrophihabitans sp. DSM 45814]
MSATYLDVDTLAQLETVIDQARGGTPTVLVITGDPGIGKTSVLDELAARATGFEIKRSEGYETVGAVVPYSVLARWGVEVASATDPLTPTLATQRLRAMADEATQHRPLLLILDDLQWADPESIEVAIELITRATGDPLLLATASRPLVPTAHPAWQRWTTRPGRTTTITLTGLNLDDATKLIDDIKPGTDKPTAKTLWEHTGGNPLYLTSMVTEYEAEQLSRMQVLPAPAAFTQTLSMKLARQPEQTRTVAQAISTLGAGWLSVFDVAAVAELPDVSEAIQRLMAEQIVQVRRSAPTDMVRVEQGLIRAAIYQSIPTAVRRGLHARAAKIVTGRAPVLDHRVAAAERYDDALAADLEDYAASLHNERSYRLAAHYRRAASALSESRDERELRWLESLFDTLFSGDRASVRAELAEISQASDRGRRALIEGTLAVWERHPLVGIEIFNSALDKAAHDRGRPTTDDPPPMDPGTCYRIEIIRAWAGLQSGLSTEQIQSGLDRASLLEPKDPAVQGFAVWCRGQLAARVLSPEEILASVADLPKNPASVATDASTMLAWRGALYASSGRFPQAISDLTELTDRMQKGQADFGAGTFHALLGRAYWFNGQPGLARVNLRIASEFAPDYPHPLVAAITPLLPIMDEDFSAADAALYAERDLLERMPWVEAIDQCCVTEVIRLHAAGETSPKPYLGMQGAISAIRTGSGRKNAIWLVHASLAAIWATELGDAEACVNAIKAVADRLSWAEPVAEWLLGLIGEARGKGKVAITHLRAAVANATNELPLYRAHMLVDHSRLARILGEREVAAHSLELAAEAYSAVGAAGYLARVAVLRQTVQARDATTQLGLSNRERDVLTLVSEGMSYAQIARDLFITQKTVGYHLGNIYAKANVSSRHELIELVRRDPTAFALRPQT